MSTEQLIILSGPLKGHEINLDHIVTIGRHEENELVLDDSQVSRQHAEVEQTSGGTILKDVGSANGTYVGEQRVLEFRLSDGDVFQIGSVEIRYQGSSDASNLAPAETFADSSIRFEETEPARIEAAPAENVYQTLFTTPRDTVDAEQLREVQKRLAAVYEANQIIASERDLESLFARVMDQIIALVSAHSGVILLRDRKTGRLVEVYERCGKGAVQIQVSRTIITRAFDEGEALLVHDASLDERFELSESIKQGNIGSAMCVPLIHQEETLGVLYVDTRGAKNAFTNQDRDLFVALAGAAATAIKNAQYVDQLEHDFQTTLKLLANAIELRDHYTLGHTWRVTNFALAIAEEMGWDKARLKIVEMGGVLHDVGKIAVEDAVLRKPSKLTAEEYDKMKVHPERGAALMRESEKLEPLIPYCLYHHERYDGKGYPYGLVGEDIPIEGRIVAVADTFDAMTSNRPYRKGLDPEIAVAEIEKNKGTQFDPDIADAFIRVYKAGKISHILQEYHKEEGKSVVCPFCSTYISVGAEEDVGIILECEVCHRSIRLEEENDAYVGVLVHATEMNENGGDDAT